MLAIQCAHIFNATFFVNKQFLIYKQKIFIILKREEEKKIVSIFVRQSKPVRNKRFIFQDMKQKFENY